MELIAPVGGRTPINIQGSKTAAEIAQINQDIADGLVSHSPGTPIVLSAAGSTNGTVYRLKGVGRTAAFVIDSGAGAVSDFNLLPYGTKLKLGGTGIGCFATFSTGATGFTFALTTAFEGAYDAIQIGVFNSDTVPIVGVTAAVYSPSVLQADNSAAANYNSATLTDMPWNGAASGTLTAGAATASPSITWTDVTPIQSPARADSGKLLPLGHIRVSFPVGVNGTYCIGPGASGAGWESDNAATLNRPYRVRQQPVIAASNATKAALTTTATSTAYWPPCIIRYFMRNGAIRQVFVAGDSISEGYGGTVVGVGWVNYMQDALSTGTTPVEVCNAAVGGSTSAQIYSNTALFASLVPGATMIHPNGSPNDAGGTITAANVLSWRGLKAKLRQLAVACGMKSIMWTMLPINAKAWGASDAARVTMNAEDLASTGFKVWDFAAPMSGPTVGGQVTMINTTDGTHPGDPGHVVMAAVGLSKVTL